MKQILGIDLGTNSLGWALVVENQSIIDGGVIIFPKGNNEDKSGKETSYSQMRTVYRGTRRRLYRRKLRRRRLLAIALKYFGLNEKQIFTDSNPLRLYQLRFEGLEKKLTPEELFRISLYFAKKRGFLSNRKDQMKESAKETGEVKKAIIELEEEIIKTGNRTLGEYYYKLMLSHNKGQKLEERVLERWTSRKMYIDEFDQIIKAQLSFGSEFINQELAESIKKQIFYQRQLKSVKHLIAKCRFESNKRCMPRSHPVFQEFRAWQIISNLRWVNPDSGESDGLNLDQKNKIYQIFQTDPKPTESKLKKAIGISLRTKFNDLEIKPCKTQIQFNQIFNKYELSFNEFEQQAIYHSLLFTQDNSKDKMTEFLLNKFNIPIYAGKELWDVILEPDYSSISFKAAMKILPFLRQGMRYDEACIEAGYHHSFEHKFKDLDFVPNLKTNELRNPVVQKAVSNCINLVNNIIRKYGKPDEVRIELARELKKPKAVREQIRNNNRNKETKREIYKEILEKRFDRVIANSESILQKYELWLELGCESDDFKDFEVFAKEVKKGDLEKYHLWLEADRISPYTGKVIPLSQLLSSEIEIEHILPFSRSLDNSFMNKTLCERSFNNLDKKNLTPVEYFRCRPNMEFDAFKKRIALFSNPNKSNIFLTDQLPNTFSNNQLSDTGYIATKAIEKIQQCIEKVNPTKGGVTSFIRKELGLNSILHYGDDINLKNQIKNRGDHRHHFIDAVVIAATTTSITQQLSRAKSTGDGRLDIDIHAPWMRFRSDVEDIANGILVVHRNQKKVVKSSTNKYKHSKSDIQPLIQKAIRGSMHEDQLYGQIINPYTGESNYVIRKKLIELKEEQLGKIVDGGIKIFLEQEIRRVGSFKELIKSPIIFNGKPLHRVRWINTSKELIQLREDTKTFVESGNNFVLAIYEGESGKREYESVNFYNAVKNKFNGNLIFAKTKSEKPLLYYLNALDKLIIYNESPEEINWNDLKEISERLYHVLHFTGNTIHCGKSTIAKMTILDKMPIKFQCNTNTLKAIKVKLDVMGNVKWRSDIGHIIK